MSNFQSHWSKQRQGETPQPPEPGQLEEHIGNSGSFGLDPVKSCVLIGGKEFVLMTGTGSSGWNLPALNNPWQFCLNFGILGSSVLLSAPLAVLSQL